MDGRCHVSRIDIIISRALSQIHQYRWRVAPECFSFSKILNLATTFSGMGKMQDVL